MSEERLDILAWLEEETNVAYIADSNGHREAVCTCPACGRDQKLWVNLQSGAWTCYYCLSYGPAQSPLVPLYQIIHDCSKDEARQALFRLRGARPSRSSRPVSSREPEAPKEWKGFLPDEFEPVYDENGWNVPDYILNRGISALTARDYELGYCQTGPYAGRVILPIVMGGETMGFQGRAVSRDKLPKYDQPKGMPKSRLLFGFDKIAQGSTVLVTEGAFDVLGSREAELNAVATFGKAASIDQVDLILSLRPSRVVVATDPYEQDPTAPWSGVRTCDLLWNKGFKNVGLLICPGKDPADLGVDEPDVFQQLVAEAKWPGERVRQKAHSEYQKKMRALREEVLARAQGRR